MKAIKITKKSIIILICIISLIAIGIVAGYFINKKINNPYGVKVVDLPIPDDYQYYNFSENNKYFIQNADDFNNIFDNRYAELNEEQKKNYKSDKKIFSKYNDKFFEKNFVYVISQRLSYSGGASQIPRFNIKKCFYSESKHRLIIEAVVIDKVKQSEWDNLNLESPIPSDWRGYIIEFPRFVFEEYDLTYDDIQIAYLNIKPHYKTNHAVGAIRYGNSQLGLDKYFNDPDYPSPNFLSR